MPKAHFHRKAHDAGLKHGWRSGLEELNCKDLKARGVEYAYEKMVLPFTPRPKLRKYTPDIVLLANSIVVELKGRFTTADRQKHIEVKATYPELDLRFVFSNPDARISKKSQTTYALWCETHGFQYAAKVVPAAWLKEPPNALSRAIINQYLKP